MKQIRSLRLRIIFFNSLIIFAALCLVVGGIVAGIVYFFNNSVQADMEFFVTQTAYNLSAKTELMEDMLLALRANPSVMSYSQRGTDAAFSDVSAQFRRTVNLYSDKNRDDMSQPFISSVYLYGKSGTVLSTHYEHYLQTHERALDARAVLWCTAARESGFDVNFFTDDNVIAVVFSLYTDFMQDVGSIMFIMKKDSLLRLIYSSAEHQNVFAVLYNKYNQSLLTAGEESYSRQAFWLFSSKYGQKPFSATVAGVPCLLYNQSLHMGMNVIIGVPRNRVLIRLIDSTGLYLLIILAGFALIIVLSSITVVRLTLPLKQIAATLAGLDGDHYDIKLPEYDSLEFNDISCKFNEMTSRLSYLIRDVYQKRIMLRENELKFLQSQMNPHFLFNVLNTLAIKARFDGNEDIYRMVTSFSKLAQASIYRRDKEKIALSEELQLVEFYLYLQSCRFGEKLAYSIRVCDSVLLQCSVPKLIIQLIVENAVLHGIEPKTDKGTVIVSVESDGSDIFISVKDDGAGFAEASSVIELPLPQNTPTERHNRVGLNNVHELIRYFYGNGYGLSIRSERGKGTTVLIHLPIDREAGDLRSAPDRPKDGFAAEQGGSS